MGGERSEEWRSTLASLHRCRTKGVAATLYLRADVARQPEQAETIVLLAVVMVLQDARDRRMSAASAGAAAGAGAAGGSAAC